LSAAYAFQFLKMDELAEDWMDVKDAYAQAASGGAWALAALAPDEFQSRVAAEIVRRLAATTWPVKRLSDSDEG